MRTKVKSGASTRSGEPRTTSSRTVPGRRDHARPRRGVAHPHARSRGTLARVAGDGERRAHDRPAAWPGARPAREISREDAMSASSKIDVDLYSDTVTKPTAAMRRFLCDAPVGDEQKGEDPTVNELQEAVAELLGKEAAVFLPSGTMCNEIALRVHCRPGEEMLAHRTAHPTHFEAGGPGALGGVNVRPLDGP